MQAIPEDPAMAGRAAFARLLQFQLRTPADGLARWGAVAMAAELNGFAQACLVPTGPTWDAGAWERLCSLLIDSALAQPVVAMLPALGLDAVEGAIEGDVPAGVPVLAGPLLHDVAALLRDTPREEPVELDLAVRWWEAARAAGLPVERDFGECWRAIEWQGLQRHLSRLGRLYAGQRDTPGPQFPRTAADRAEAPHLWTQTHKVALRYAAFKPLTFWVEPASGAAVVSGDTF